MARCCGERHATFGAQLLQRPAAQRHALLIGILRVCASGCMGGGTKSGCEMLGFDTTDRLDNNVAWVPTGLHRWPSFPRSVAENRESHVSYPKVSRRSTACMANILPAQMPAATCRAQAPRCEPSSSEAPTISFAASKRCWQRAFCGTFSAALRGAPRSVCGGAMQPANRNCLSARLINAKRKRQELSGAKLSIARDAEDCQSGAAQTTCGLGCCSCKPAGLLEFVANFAADQLRT